MTLHGENATLYIGAWARSQGRYGLNARRLSADALAGGRSALQRLRLAAFRTAVRATAPFRASHAAQGRSRPAGRRRARRAAIQGKAPNRPRRSSRAPA